MGGLLIVWYRGGGNRTGHLDGLRRARPFDLLPLGVFIGSAVLGAFAISAHPGALG